MTHPRRKIETPENKSSRAESVPGSGKEKAKKNTNEKFLDASSIFAVARDTRLRAEMELQSLKQSTAFNTKREITTAQQAKLEEALTRVNEAKEEEILAAGKAVKSFAGGVPKEMEKMTADAAFDLFLQSEDELRAAKQELKNTPPVTKDKKEQKKRTEELYALADAVAKLEKKNEQLRLATMSIEMKELLGVTDDIRVGLDSEESDTEIATTSSREIRAQIAGYDVKIEEAENEIDALKEKGASDVIIQEKVHALTELKEERTELEREIAESSEREVAGAEIAQGFGKIIEEARKDELLAPTAEEYTALDAARKKMETKIKKLTGHPAEDILVNPSLSGGVFKRFGTRLKGFISKLAGDEAEPHADDLMREWKAVNSRMEELAQTLQPTIDIGHEYTAVGRLAKTDETMEVKRAHDREAAREWDDDSENRDHEYQSQAEFLVNDVKSELSEILLYDDTAQFLEHKDTHATNNEAYQERLSLIKSHESPSSELQGAITELEGIFETYERALESKFSDIKTFEEAAKTAGKGERVVSKVRARKVSTGIGRMGTEAVGSVRRVEHLETEGPKTELSTGPDQYMDEIQQYRQDKASEIRVAMREYEPAAELWEKMNEVLGELLDPDEYEKISSLLGTRDLATAYVLAVAFANLDRDTEARERVKKVNKILLIADDANIEQAGTKERKKVKKLGDRKKKSKKKKAA